MARWFSLFSFVLRYGGVPLFIIAFAEETSYQTLYYFLNSLMQSGEGETPMLFFLGALSLLSDLFWSVTTLLCVFYFIKKSMAPSETLADFVGVHIQQLAIETIRMAGSILTWSLFLVLPGVFRALTLIFTPLIVIFDSQYQRGSVDALKKASQLFYSRLLSISGLVLVLYLIPSLIPLSFPESDPTFAETPGWVLIHVIWRTLVTLLFSSALYSFYEKLTSLDPLPKTS